jgi:hypothetical protein
LGHFWDFIKSRFAHYAQRREFLRDEFAPMLDVLEGSTSLTPKAVNDRWKSHCFRLFISHSAKHKSFAQDLQEKLLGYKISGFVAHTDISPTAEWQLQIELALRECDALAALLTPDFHSRIWTDQEVGWVLGLGKAVIGVRLGADPYGFLGKYQGLAVGTGDASTVGASILKVLRKHESSRRRVTEAHLLCLEHTQSYADARAVLALLAGDWGITSADVARVEKSATINENLGRNLSYGYWLQKLKSRVSLNPSP